MSVTIKKVTTYLLISLLCSCSEHSGSLNHEKIKNINHEIIQAFKNGDLQVIDKYLYDETQIYIDLDPDPNKGSQKISLEEYRKLAEMSLQLMDDIKIETDIISIEIDHEFEQATSVVRATVNTSMLGAEVKESSVSTTVFGVIQGAIKILSTRDEIISIDLNTTTRTASKTSTKSLTSKSVKKFSLSFDENELNSVDPSFNHQYLSICTAQIKSIDQANPEQLCSIAVAIIYQVSHYINATPKDEIELYNNCEPQNGVNKELLSCIEDQSENLISLMAEGIEVAMCLFPNSTVILNDGWNNRSQRGNHVYRSHRLAVDCKLKQFDYVENDFFYPESLTIDDAYKYRWDDYLEAIYKALESSDKSLIEMAIKQHIFGEDEWKDKQFIELFISDPDYFPWLEMMVGFHEPDLNFNVDYYRQPLSYAIEANNQRAAMFLLDHGANPFIPSEYGTSHLELAVSFGMFDLVKYLLDKGMDPDGLKGSEDLSFGQPLVKSAETGNQLLFNLLLERGALLAPINPADYPNWQVDDLLVQAIHGGNLEIIKTLFENGVTIPSTKRTLAYIISGNQPEIMTLMRNQGLTLPPVNEHEALLSALLDVIDRADLTSLENAFSIFNTLEEMGLDLSQSFNPNKSIGYQLVYQNLTTPITFAENPDDDSIKQIRNDFAQTALAASVKDGIDINQANENKTTLLMHAAKLGQHQIIKSLIDYGVDVKLEDENGKTALEIAEKQAENMMAYHPQDMVMQEKYQTSILWLKKSSEHK